MTKYPHRQTQLPTTAFLLGGGPSIQEGIEKGLREALQGKLTINMNYGYTEFPNATITAFVDYEFYTGNKKSEVKNIPEHLEWVRNAPLLIGLNDDFNIKKKYDNTLFVDRGYVKEGGKVKEFYGKDGLKQKKLYAPSLCGTFALSFAVCLGVTRIYILGYDGIGPEGTTHYYDFKHRGYGHTAYYTMDKEDQDFSVFTTVEGIEIINVSLNSYINIFKKIGYDEFFKEIDNKIYNQTEMREEIRRIYGRYV